MSFSESVAAAFPQSIWILLAVCAVLCAVGFKKFVYFLSVGYGFAISGAGLFLLIAFGKDMSASVIILSLLFVVYGIRLSGFLIYREVKSATYRKTLAAATKEEKPIPVFVKIFVWIFVSMMYVTQVSPVFYRCTNENYDGASAIIGAIIMICALVLESVADKQKSEAKKKNPKKVCDQGLYKLVRCPNYLGELLFWTGVFVTGFGSNSGAMQWIISIIGYLLIIYVMFSGAKRLELRQNKSYGSDKAYQAYVNSTPIILPFIPLYHLADVKFIVA